jgi:hypothetical protein
LTGTFAIERVGVKPFTYGMCVTREDRNGKTFRVPEPELARSSCINLLAAKQKRSADNSKQQGLHAARADK